MFATLLPQVILGKQEVLHTPCRWMVELLLDYGVNPNDGQSAEGDEIESHSSCRIFLTGLISSSL